MEKILNETHYTNIINSDIVSTKVGQLNSFVNESNSPQTLVTNIISNVINKLVNGSNISNMLDNETFLNSSDSQYHLKIKKNTDLTLKDFMIFLIDILIIIGPSLGYFLQALKFNKTKSSKGFSKLMCLIVYISQVLRVFFWIGKPFVITLLYQSLLIIISQIYLMHLWVKYHHFPETVAITTQSKVISASNNRRNDLLESLLNWSDTINMNKIWNWKKEIEYYKFMLLIVFAFIVFGAITGIHNAFIANLFGTLSVIFEILTLVPQIIVSYKTKNAKNLSTLMVTLWLLGECGKLIYNIVYKAPIQMLICGGIQIFIDSFILFQILFYNNIKKDPEKDINNSNTELNSNVKIPRVQQINQFMNKIEENYSEGIQKIDEVYNKKINNDNGNNDNNKMKELPNSDNIEVLDRSKEKKIKFMSDDKITNAHHYRLEEEPIPDDENKKELNEENGETKLDEEKKD